MARQTRFEGIVCGMVEVLDCPLTVKMRTGIYKKNWNAHKLVPKLREWGVSLVTVRPHPYNVHLMSCMGKCRYMVAQENSAILSWPIGTILGHAWKQPIPCLSLVCKHEH